MGAYQLFRIEFKGKEVRDYFEKINEVDNTISKPKRLFQYKDGDNYECTYYMGWDGYALGGMCLDIIKKAKMFDKIKSFKLFDLSVGTSLFDELKRYKEE